MRFSRRSPRGPDIAKIPADDATHRRRNPNAAPTVFCSKRRVCGRSKHADGAPRHSAPTCRLAAEPLLLPPEVRSLRLRLPRNSSRSLQSAVAHRSSESDDSLLRDRTPRSPERASRRAALPSSGASRVLRLEPMNSTSNLRCKVITGDAGYVLEDVPHLSDYIPGISVLSFTIESAGAR